VFHEPGFVGPQLQPDDHVVILSSDAFSKGGQSNQATLVSTGYDTRELMETLI
jgi:hypothetical protein